MKKKPQQTYRNLLDFSIMIDQNSSIAGNPDEIFRSLMTDFFFVKAGKEKTMMNFFKNYETPEFMKKITNLREINIEDLESFLDAETINDTFAGTVILSKAYLKTFHSNHQPEFKQMPKDIQYELIDEIKAKNKEILDAFNKMFTDIEADKNRTILQLVALIIKNVHLKTGTPLKELNLPADKIIRKHISNANDTFTGKQATIKDLTDDTKIKAIIKDFFIVKKFEDITSVAEDFKKEFKRFLNRAILLKSEED